MGEHWPPAQTGHNLCPVPGASCSLQPGWAASEAAATWDQPQLFGGHPLARSFFPAPGTSGALLGGAGPGSHLLAPSLSTSPNPTVLSACQGIVGEGQIQLLGLSR